MIGKTVGNFELVREISRSETGVLYEARHSTLLHPMAVKVLWPQVAASTQYLERFQDDARTLARVRHPGVVRIADYGDSEGGGYYIAMERLRGESLQARIDRRQRLDIAEAVRVAQQVAEVLVVAHRHGLWHRDLRPSHVLLTPGDEGDEAERPVLLDFGLCPIERHDPYQAPEQVRNQGEVDAKVDVHGLGVLLYCAVTGRPPFEEEGDRLLERISQDIPPPLSRFRARVPVEVEGLTQALLAKDPRRRPSMEEVAARLSALSARLAERGEADPTTEQKESWQSETTIEDFLPTPGPTGLRRYGPAALLLLLLLPLPFLLRARPHKGAPPRPAPVEPGAAARLAPVKVEPVKVEPVKVEPVKVEPVKVEPVKVAKVEPPSVVAAKAEAPPAKAEPVAVAKVEAPPAKAEPVAAAKAEAPPAKAAPAEDLDALGREVAAAHKALDAARGRKAQRDACQRFTELLRKGAQRKVAGVQEGVGACETLLHRYDAAQSAYQQELAAWPQRHAALIGLAFAEEKLRQRDAARRHYQDYLDKTQADAEWRGLAQKRLRGL